MAYARPILTASMSSADLLRIANKFGLAASELNRSVAAAVNDVAAKARGLTRKRVLAHVNLPMHRVNAAVQITSRATSQNPTAIVALDSHAKGRSERPTLMSFKGSPKMPPYETKAAVKLREAGKKARKRNAFTYQILKGGAKVTLPGGFVARPKFRGIGTPGVSRAITDGSAAALAFVQSRSAPQRGPVNQKPGENRKTGYPLTVPKGPSVAALWQNPANDIAVDVLTELTGMLPKRIEGQARKIFDAKFKRIFG